MSKVDIDPFNLADENSNAGLLPFLASEIKQRIIDDDIDGLKSIMSQISKLSEQLLLLNGEVDEKRREYTRMRNRMKDLEEQEERQRKAREALMADMRKEFGIVDEQPDDVIDSDITVDPFANDLDIPDYANISLDDPVEDVEDDIDENIVEDSSNDSADDDISSVFDFDDDADDVASVHDDSLDDDFAIDFDDGYDGAPTAPASSGDSDFLFDSDPFDLDDEDDDADPFVFSGSRINNSPSDATASIDAYDDNSAAYDHFDDEYMPIDASYDDEEELLARIEEEKKEVERRRKNTVYSDVASGESSDMRANDFEFNNAAPDGEDDYLFNDSDDGFNTDDANDSPEYAAADDDDDDNDSDGYNEAYVPSGFAAGASNPHGLDTDIDDEFDEDDDDFFS